MMVQMASMVTNHNSGSNMEDTLIEACRNIMEHKTPILPQSTEDIFVETMLQANFMDWLLHNDAGNNGISAEMTMK